MQTHFKSSIMIPRRLMARWQRDHRRLLLNPGPRLMRLRQRPTRQRQRRYHARGSNCIKVNVCWRIGVYNQLHGIAAAVRMSVSALLTELLSMAEFPARKEVSRYFFAIVEWSDDRRKIIENLEKNWSRPRSRRS